MTNPHDKSQADKIFTMKLSVAEWVKVILFISGICIVQTWIASKYVAGLESRLSATELKNTEQDEVIRREVDSMSLVRDKIYDSLLKISVDLAEIKGKLEGRGDHK